MKYVLLPDEQQHSVAFYLAMEEYVASLTDEPECFFTWQVEPSVIFGRNQQMENEVDEAYCRQHGIRMFQRKSGGGCVYADRDNLMLSMVAREENVGVAYNIYINMVMLVLRNLGLKAVTTSHNDIMVGDRKVSGTACYKLGNCCIVHGTLLYDTNMDNMLHAITPPTDKLQRHGVESVRQRIGLLKDYVDIGMDDLQSKFRQQLCRGELQLAPDDVVKIEKLSKKYTEII